MGLGESTDINFGLVGIGYKTDEAIVSSEDDLSYAYNNLPLMMVKEGVINTNAYSLWLNDLGGCLKKTIRLNPTFKMFSLLIYRIFFTQTPAPAISCLAV